MQALKNKPAERMGEPLRAYGRKGEVIALSYNGGKSWTMTPDGGRVESTRAAPAAIEYRARVCALVETLTPSFERRIVAPFSAFARERIQAGWAIPAFLEATPDNRYDAMTLAGLGYSAEAITMARAHGRGIVLDLDEPIPGERSDPIWLAEVVSLVNLITVPTERMAQSLRRHHGNVFVIPPVIDEQSWRGLQKPLKRRGERLRIGYTDMSKNEALALAMAQIEEKYGERQIELVHYDWWTLSRAEEHAFYPTLDIAVVGDALPYGSAYPVIVAATGGAAPVVGRGFGRALKHGHDGLVVGQVNDHRFWRKAIGDLINDSRERELLTRNARNGARRYAATAHASRLVLPYKLLITSQLLDA